MRIVLAVLFAILASPAQAACVAYGQVYLFDSPGCIYCAYAKRFLAMNQIPYQVIDAQRYDVQQFMLQNYRVTMTPVVANGSQYRIGYSEPLLRQLFCLS